MISMELALIAMKYQSGSNPFFDHASIVPLFLAAIFCQSIALIADVTVAALVHSSGITGFQILLWIIFEDLWTFIIFNVVLSIVATLSICYIDVLNVLKAFIAWISLVLEKF